MSMAPVPVSLVAPSPGIASSSSSRDNRWRSPPRFLWGYSIMLFALSREGMAGVCGVCGEIGFPGDDDIDIDVPETMGVTAESCRLEELEDLCKWSDDDIESDKAAFESRMR